MNDSHQHGTGSRQKNRAAHGAGHGEYCSRKQETAADLFAVDLLRRARRSTDGAISFMSKTSAMETRSSLEEYLSTHPDADKRLLALRRELGQGQ